MLRMSIEERRTRLGVRHALARDARVETPVEAAAAVVALHGTDAASVYLSALARMRSGDIDAVATALYDDRELLRVLAMRRTMFVAPVDTAAVLLAACSQTVAARERRKLIGYLEAAGVADDVDSWLAGAEQAALDALKNRGEATAPEIAADDPRLATKIVLGEGTNYQATPTVASRVLTVLGAQGDVIRTRPAGGWTSTQFSWARLADWHAGVEQLEPEPARAELARLWLLRFGPASADDLRWWTGWNVGETRKALAALDTAEVDLDGAPGIVLADDAEPAAATEPWAALLPALDATTMGWKERDWYLGGHRELLFDRNGNASPTVWCDGRIVGGWAQAPDGEIRIRLLDDVGEDAVQHIEQAAAELTERVGDAKLSPRARARSRVEQELLA